MTLSRPPQPLKARRSRTLSVVPIAIALLILLVPTIHSAIYQRVYADTWSHSPDVYPSGFSGLEFPIKAGDFLVFKFTGDRLFDIQVSFRDTLAKPETNVSVYNEERLAQGQMVYHAPGDGRMDMSWRPSTTGPSSITYVIRVIPNLGGMSLLPYLSSALTLRD